MPSSKLNSSQDLRYPPVQINHSLEELDLDTLIMRSTSRRLPEEAGSALDDSTFEILGDSLIETSDDEAHTESIASTDDCTPDDSSDFSDDNVDYEADARELQHSTASLHADAPEQHDSRSLHATEDSTLTEVPSYRGDSGDSRRIRLDEQPMGDAGVSQGTKVIRSFPDKSGFMYPVFEQYGCSQVRLVIKGALSHASIPTPDSYRILYIGMPSKWDEDAITSKIGAALRACPSTSKSIMVQGQLEPYGPIMDVCRCAATKILSQGDEPARIALSLDNGTQLTFGPGDASTSEGRPDLVVFCHPSAPRSIADAQEFTHTREVFDREKLPYIELISIRHYGHGALSYDSKSLSVCMEGRNDPKADFELKEVFPLDHYTFGDLEPSQINRHLALISPHMMAPAAKSQQTVRPGDTWKASAKRLGAAQLGPAKMLVLFTVLTAMVVGYLFGPILVPMLSGSRRSIEAEAIFTPYSDLCTSRPSPALIPPTPISVSAPSSVSSTPRDLTLVPPQIKPRKQVKKRDEKQLRFEVQTTGDHQFTLVPHEDLLTARKKPQLQIQVSRELVVIPIRYNRTISGVYVVDLEQQYPFGVFNVSIASYSKPLIQQTFEVALGHNKSGLSQLFDNAMSTMADTQQSFMDFSTSTVHVLLANLPDVDTFASMCTHEIRESGQEVVARWQDARRMITNQLNARISILKHAQDVAWTGVQEATAPIRTSSVLWRIRMNALRVRCMAEQTAGFSSTGISGKESWACSKLRDLC
jgi:hypothetical protein